MNRNIKLNNTLTHTHTSYFLRSFDLSSVYKTGVIQTWLPITYSKKNKPSGSIHVILTFFGSETRFGPLLSRKETRYPCLGSGTTYGDSERINVVEKLDGTLLASPVSKQGKQGKSAGLVESVGGEAVGARPGQSFGSAPPVSQDYTVNVKAAGSGKGVSKEESGRQRNLQAEERVAQLNWEAAEAEEAAQQAAEKCPRDCRRLTRRSLRSAASGAGAAGRTRSPS